MRRLPILVFLVAAGCRSGPFKAGDQVVTVEAAYGEPTRRDPLWWVGVGESASTALTVTYSRYTCSRLAWTVEVTPARLYDQIDGTVWSGDLQGGLRWDIVDFTVYRRPVYLYGIMTGGVMYASKSVPAERGSHTNLTQDLGLGFEISISDTMSMVTGYRLEHISNGSGSNLDNPSQNNHVVFLGLAFRW